MLDFARDKALWARVRTDDAFAVYRKEIKDLYEKSFREEPRPHSVEETLSRPGNMLWRLHFDQLQSAALMALIYPEEEIYFDSLLKIIWAYLNDYSWAPLGHFTMQYYGKTAADFDCGLIDIFAASAGFALAEIKSLFRDRFPRLIADRISYELKRHIIDPYLNRTFFWETHNNNWTAVCAGGVGSVLLYESPETYYAVKDRLHNAMECYLASFGEDGMCEEGVGYWGFGFGFFAAFAALERELTEGKVDWFARPKAKSIAKYLQKMFLQPDVLVTFGDCNVTQRIPNGLPFLLRHIYGDEIEPVPHLPVCVHDNTHFNFCLRSILYYDPSNVSEKLNDNVTYASEGSAYFVKRTPAYGFACKGGHNGESHNHIDVGNFILARNNRVIIADIGAGPYEDGYHTDRRYTFFHPSAASHNLPMIDGVSEDSIRRDSVPVDYDKTTDTAKMDITSAFGMEHLTSAERTFAFAPDSVTMTDRFSLTREATVTERLVTLTAPVMGDGFVTVDGVEFITEDGLMPTVTEKDVTSHMGARHKVYLLDYTLPRGVTEFRIRFAMGNE